MENEIEAAVAWWSQQLQQDTKYIATGDVFNDAMLHIAQSNLAPLSAETIQAFEGALQSGIASLIEKSGANINRSYMCVIATDYSPEGVLADAADLAHIDNQSFRFPMKTIMWINPGEVYVTRGYGASSVTIYPISSEAQ